MSRTARGQKSPVAARLRSWTIWGAPRQMRHYVLAVEAFTVGIVAYLLMTVDLTTSAIARACLLFGLSFVFEEVAGRIERMRFRLSTARNIDLTSVWTFAGALVLPPAFAVLLVVAIRIHTWMRHAKASGQLLYRQVFTCTSVVLACMSAYGILAFVGHRTTIVPNGPRGIVVIAAAVAIYTVVNHLVVYVAVSLAMRPAKPIGFFAQWQDNALELATLCLAGLTAVAVLYQPWFTLLVLPSMVVLQRSTLTKELEVAATTDSKTGLLNAITWQQLAQRELARAERENQRAALLIVDMDNFKLINDTYGHLAGDAVLKAVAGCLSGELRGYDTVGRFGGEEFVALLADSEVATAIAVSDRILARIRELEVETRDASAEAIRGLSASIGIACYPQHGNEVEDLLHAADAALYRAKKAGRDRVEFHAKSL